MNIPNAVLVPLYLHSAPPRIIKVTELKSMRFGTSLMSGGKGAITEGSIEDESTVIVEPLTEPTQYWG